MTAATTPDAIRSAVGSFYADVWNRHDKSSIASLIEPDFTFRGSLGETKRGRDGFADYVDFVHDAVGGFRCDIVELVVEAPRAFARMRFSGIHRGELFGFAPTRDPIEWPGAALFTFRGPRIADLWVLGDVHGLLRQLEQNAQRRK